MSLKLPSTCAPIWFFPDHDRSGDFAYRAPLMGRLSPKQQGPVRDQFLMASPAIYRIRVRGHINPDYAMCLESMNITSDTSPTGLEESILVGRLTDQDALSCLLNTLCDMQLPLLSVECLEAEARA